MTTDRRERLIRALVAALTRDEIYDLAAGAARLVNTQGLSPDDAVNRVVQDWQTKTGRRLPPMDIDRVRRNVKSYGGRSPNPEVRQVLRQFHQERGFPAYVPHTYEQVNPQEAAELAREYEQLPRNADPNDPGYQALKESYKHFRLWIRRQYQKLLGHVKVEEWPYPTEPYANSDEMRADVANNRHLWVFTGGTQTSAHPFLSPQENIMFRAVHDYLTHAAEGYGFGPQGEYNAWMQHARSLPDEAQMALAMETVLQNVWTNFGPHMQQNPDMPLKDRPFVDQVPVVPISRLPQRTDRPMPLK
jgi:hypothetical protein